MRLSADLPVIPAERADDLFHPHLGNLHLADKCDLALFTAGNPFMVMPGCLRKALHVLSFFTGTMDFLEEGIEARGADMIGPCPG
jgi:hypothetical protein